MLSEFAAAPRIQGGSEVNVTHIVAKYIHPGESVTEVLPRLKELGFDVRPLRHKAHEKHVPAGQVWFFATRNDPYSVFLSEETRIIVESDGAKVLKVRGWIFLKGI